MKNMVLVLTIAMLCIVCVTGALAEGADSPAAPPSTEQQATPAVEQEQAKQENQDQTAEEPEEKTGPEVATMAAPAAAFVPEPGTNDEPNAVAELEKEGTVGAVKGAVNEIRSYFDPSGTAMENVVNLMIKTEEGGEAIFRVDMSTCPIEGKTWQEIVVGDGFVGYYDSSAPMVMIYPPQYMALAVLIQ